VSNQYLFNLGLHVKVGEAAILLSADFGFRSMVPQLSDAKTVLKSTPLVSAIVAAQRRLGQGGRVLVRKSGTEPVSSQDPAPRAGLPRPL
jgi:hypothetical protein